MLYVASQRFKGRAKPPIVPVAPTLPPASSTPPPAPPASSVVAPAQKSHKPGMWETFVHGFNNPRMSYKNFLDLYLTPQEWAQKYNKTPREHRKWKKDLLFKNKNWFLRSLTNTLRKLK